MEHPTDELSQALQQMQGNLKRISEEHTERTSLQTAKNNLNERLRGDKTLKELSKDIVDFLVSYSGAQIGVIYVLEDNELHHEYAYGLNGQLNGAIQIGQGLVGQAVLEKSVKVLDKLSNKYFKIESSLGQQNPDTVAILPAVFNNKTIAVIELAKLGNFTPVQLKLLEEISEGIAITINTAFSQQAMKDLLGKLQVQKGETEKTALELAQQVECLNSAAIVSITDAEGDIIYVNDKFCEISKYSRKELMGKNHRILKSGKQPDGIFVGMWKLISLGRVWNGEIVNRAKDGSYYWVDTTITPFKGTDGKIEKYVAIRFDITEQKNQKNEIEAITNAIYKSNIAVEFDLKGNIMGSNNIFQEITGYSEKEVLGKHHSLFVEKGYEKTAEYKALWNNLKKGEVQEDVFKRVTKNGDIAWIKGTYNPILDSEGKPYKILKIASDVTLTIQQTQELAEQTEKLEKQQEELKQMNEELEEQTQNLKHQQEELQMANEELEEQAQALEAKNKELELARTDIEQKTKQLEISSKYKSEFLANMSHELRTPLNSLLILSKDLADNNLKNLNEEQVECAEIVHKSGQDLLTLINEVLDLSKIEAGKMSLEVEKVALQDLVDEINRNFRFQTEQKGLKLNVNLDKKLPTHIQTDHQRLNQILRNLLSNALKFTEKGSITANIQEHNKGSVAISVTDTGIGIPEEMQMAIFEAFQQADGGTSRKYGGTGLGLSISRELAKLIGGEIKLTSAEGKGSTFTLIIPLTIEEAEQTKSLREKVSEEAKAKSLKNTAADVLKYSTIDDDRFILQDDDQIVLIIEDDPKFADILGKQAHGKGFKFLAAATGEVGLTLVEKYQPHAILLDINLPGMSGHEVLSTLKSNPFARHIPIHIMSAEERTLEPIKEGAVEYITKPVNKKQLNKAFERIENFIERKMKNLLIVEDNENARKAMRKLIGNGDVKSFEAATGKDALKIFKRNQIDCIVLDIGLPDISGFKLIQEFGKTTKDIIPPIIVYTGKELTKEESDELQKYAESIIIKGVKSEERLLDETALFLHRTISKLPETKQRIIANLYDKDSVFKGKHILLVDDDMRNVFALSKVLKERDMEVIKAENGIIALEALEKHDEIDLVLMDIMMPEMDGYETMRKIRTMDKFESLPIIALTAKAMKDDKQKCINAGANDYVSKPVDTGRLFSLMNVWLGR